MALTLVAALAPEAACAQGRAVPGRSVPAQPLPPPPTGPFAAAEVAAAAERVFGEQARGLVAGIGEAVRRWGEPAGYILGEEGAGALLGGLRYGSGTLHTRTAEERRVFWQGPSLGLDVGGDEAQVVMLVFNLPEPEALFARFVGLDGTAYVGAGVGFNALVSGEVVVVPVRAGVGARLGVNVGYLKFTPERTWNPF